MTDFGKYKEHIEYVFHAFCKDVTHNAAFTAAKEKYRRQKEAATSRNFIR